MLLATLLIVLPIGGLIYAAASIWVARPLRQAMEVTECLAQGDLSVNIQSESKDEVGLLLVSIAAMKQSLVGIVRQVHTSADEVSSAASELSASAESVVQGSQCQSEAAASAARAVEEGSATINAVAETAEAVQSLSRTSLESSARGNASLMKMVSELERAGGSVRQIAATVGEFIDSAATITAITRQVKEIAEQTNLLALNAAIEAARAGEQGRGFAVVADEVRKLAERSSNATTEISHMIDSIQRDTDAAVNSMQSGSQLVREGVERVDEAGKAMRAITSNTQQIVAVTEDIAVSVREQSNASNDIASRIERIARLSETSDAASASTHAEAQALQQVAGELRGAMRRFQC